MKTPTNKPVCDAIMYHITTVSAESKNPSGKHFGRKMLRDTISMHVECKLVEFNVAIQWLIDNKYLKPLGQHTVGIGTGKDIKVYPLGDYKPYTSLSPDQMIAENNNAQKMHIAKYEPEPVEANPPRKSLGETTSDSARQDLAPSKNISVDVPSFVSKEARDFQRIEQSLNTLKARLNGKTIDNLTIKLRTLDELASLLDPEISNVLNQIHHDLKEIVQ